ncbi:retropepsin-like aspartic protease [Zoogloea sp.]|uniref:retropepsin-like aspartic protease family protein n=1 Tax=Zoogloea sp. TaxID=49181 RepID=UPI002606A5A8|nr:retropepsin-like aspartic protease [Zoogloea sp.]MDD3352023.1 retropepsin-like aspartic protease [Zoogloea sp.]
MSKDEEGRRFGLPDAAKEAHLQAVKARLQVGPEGSPGRRDGGSLWPSILFWTALIGLGTWGASHWLSSSRGARDFQVLADGALELRLGRGGHYEVGGSVEGLPVRFLVDTGASVSSVSRALGERLGIRACPAVGFDLSASHEPGCCRPQVFSTANGQVEACVARVPSLRFGPFEVRHARVAVMPGMDDQALLGMDVLRHFRLVQQDRRLVVSRSGEPGR